MNQRFTYTMLPSSIPFADNHTFSAKERDPETGLSYFGSRYYSSDLSVWLSVDPMAAKYPGLSPYVYCADNPVKLVDPNGEEVWIIGENWSWATKRLSSTYAKLGIQRDENGKLSTTINDVSNLSKNEKKLYDAINNSDVKINFTVNNKNRFESKDGKIITSEEGGSFMGNQLSNDLKTAYAEQFASKDEIEKKYSSKGNDIGQLLGHEITEAYAGGQYSIANGVAAEPAYTSQQSNPAYDYGHDNAIPQPPTREQRISFDCLLRGVNRFAYDYVVPKYLQY